MFVGNVVVPGIVVVVVVIVEMVSVVFEMVGIGEIDGMVEIEVDKPE